MKAKAILCFFITLLIVISAFAQETGPTAISPGSEGELAIVDQNCPTFSWISVDWAVAYKVVVFETTGSNVLDYKEREAISSPVLTREIQGRSLSWTPSKDERLVIGSMYVWYI